jgi:hypothetical protein
MYAKFELSFSPGRSSISVTIAGPAPAGRTTGGAAGAALAADSHCMPLRLESSATPSRRSVSTRTSAASASASSCVSLGATSAHGSVTGPSAMPPPGLTAAAHAMAVMDTA